MAQLLRHSCKLSALGFIGGTTYYMIEIMYRGYSHWTMGLLGAFCFIFIGLINEYLSWDTPLWLQGLIGSGIVTTLEFIFGCVLNLWLGLGIWNYSLLPINILGQICLPFSLIWVVLSIIAIILDDWLRYWLFKEDKPKYKWL